MTARLLSDWLVKGEVQKLVIVINGAESGEVLERWVFNVETDKDSIAGGLVISDLLAHPYS